jgi:hypothetical protein
MANPTGLGPVVKSYFEPKVPAPALSSSVTTEPSRSPTARSGFPSPFKSPIATLVGVAPVG